MDERVSFEGRKCCGHLRRRDQASERIYLKRAVFADILRLNYITFDTAGAGAFDHAHIRFTSKENRNFFQFPSGKTADGVTISGYRYGALKYPIARNEPGRDLPAK